MLRRIGILVRALGALTTLTGLVTGPPLLMALATRWATRATTAHIADAGGLWAALTSRDDSGHLFVLALLAVGWGAWATFLTCVVEEIRAAVRGRRARRLPGLGPQQRLAAALIAAILLLAGAPAVAGATPATAVTPHGVAGAGTTVVQQDPGGAEAVVYEVARHDRLADISARFTGAAGNYPAIARDNQIRNPDLIHPHQRITLPPEATDRGPRQHANGTVTPPPAGTGTTTPSAPSDSPPDEGAAGSPPSQRGTPGGRGPRATDPAPPQWPVTPPAGPPTTATPPADSTPAGATTVGTTQESPTNGDAVLRAAATATLAGAGLLAALTLRAVLARRRVQQRHRRPGRRLPNPAGGATERRLRAAEQPLDVDRIDAALRALTTGLAGRTPHALPDVAAVWVVDQAVRLHLAQPQPHPPAPWQTDGDTWVLPADVAVPVAADAAAALPALVTVGSRPGSHLLVDLERAGVLTVGGDRDGVRTLVGYLAAELACATWAEEVDVVLSGFDADQAAQLVALNPHRVRIAEDPAQAVAQLRDRAGAGYATLRSVGAPDALAARVGDLAADAWAPQVLLLADPDAAAHPAVADLTATLIAGGRCAVAAVIADPANADASLQVTAEGALRIQLAGVRETVAATSLPSAELQALAELMTQARTGTDQPVPPAADPEAWAAATDAAGTVLADPLTRAAVPSEPDAPDTPVPIAAPPAATVDEPPSDVPMWTISGRSDPGLDADLRDWYAATVGRPRVGVLGPVTVRAPGPEPEQRRRFLAEIVAYLAQRGARGATRDQLEDALWPEQQVHDGSLRVAITRARRWLGTTPAGQPWLPNQDTERRYRLTDGYLLDWHLFRRLRTRAQRSGDGGTEDLRAALELVRGAPLEGADRAYAAGARNPYTWLPESEIYPPHLVAAIADTAHDLAQRYLERGDTSGARWAVERAWQADPYRGDDELWHDLLQAEHTDGHTVALRALLGQLLTARDAEIPEDLPPRTYALLCTLLPDDLGIATPS